LTCPALAVDLRVEHLALAAAIHALERISAEIGDQESPLRAKAMRWAACLEDVAFGAGARS